MFIMVFLLFQVQTLAIVPIEILPQGSNISLDKHLERKAWQEVAFPKKTKTKNKNIKAFNM